MAGALVHEAAFTGKDITSETNLITKWTNDTGIDLVVCVQVLFSSLANDIAETLTMKVVTKQGSGATNNTIVVETFNKIASTGMEWTASRLYPLVAIGGINVKALASDAGDNAVAGTVYIFAANVVNVYSVGYATPESFSDVPSSIIPKSWGDWLRKAARRFRR